MKNLPPMEAKTLPSMYLPSVNSMTIIEQCNYGDRIINYCYGDPALVGNRVGGDYTTVIFKIKPKAKEVSL